MYAAELFNGTFKLVAMIRTRRANARDADRLWKVLVNLYYEVTEKGRHVDTLMN